ncbi:MAG: hypothetical protein AAF206_16840 [Bacteroidota bacterium]
MDQKIIYFLFLSFWTLPMMAQKACPNPQASSFRFLAPGTGPTKQTDYSKDFTCSTCFHFVQFGVYQANTDKYSIRAPKDVEEVWLIKHDRTVINGRAGAMYMVKAFASENKARQFVQLQRGKGKDCWYNPNLTGSDFELLSVSQ